MALPVPLRLFFVLPPISAHVLKISSLGGRCGHEWQCCLFDDPCLALCGAMRTRQARPSGAECRRLRKGCTRTQYVDNFISFATDPERDSELENHVAGTNRERGLPVHEEILACSHAPVLCWDFEGQPGDRLAATWLDTFPCAVLCSSGPDRARRVGRYTFLARGCALSHAFARKHEKETVPLWSSVRQELKWMKALLSILEPRKNAPWFSALVSSDASEEGQGIVRAVVDSNETRDMAHQSDTWRPSRAGQRAQMTA